MGKVIAVANQKGGVGKTTTAVNLSAALAEKGQKILVVDIDPQGNATSGFGVDKNHEDNNSYALLMDDCSINEAILHDVIPNIDLIPSNMNLAGAEVELMDVPRRERILKNALDYVKDGYDFIFMDCPPSLNILTVNAMTAADSVLVPIQCEFYALEGLSQLIYTINMVRKQLNKSLTIEGIVMTMFDSHTNLSQQVVEDVKNNSKQRVYSTTIPRNVRLAEAPSYGQPITMYDPRSAGAEAYRKLAEEILQDNRGRKSTVR